MPKLTFNLLRTSLENNLPISVIDGVENSLEKKILKDLCLGIKYSFFKSSATTLIAFIDFLKMIIFTQDELSITSLHPQLFCLLLKEIEKAPHCKLSRIKFFNPTEAVNDRIQEWQASTNSKKVLITEANELDLFIESKKDLISALESSLTHFYESKAELEKSVDLYLNFNHVCLGEINATPKKHENYCYLQKKLSALNKQIQNTISELTWLQRDYYELAHDNLNKEDVVLTSNKPDFPSLTRNYYCGSS